MLAILIISGKIFIRAMGVDIYANNLLVSTNVQTDVIHWLIKFIQVMLW